MLHHVSDAVEWFNKERFEELTEWLLVILLLDGFSPTATNRLVATRMAEVERSLGLAANLAQEVGYRSRLFVGLPEKAATKRTPALKKRVQ
jgi:hypothetical protein